MKPYINCLGTAFIFLFFLGPIRAAEIQVIDYSKEEPKGDLLKFTINLRDGEKKVKEICGDENFNKNEVIHEYLKGKSGDEMILLLRTDIRKNPKGQMVQDLVGFMIAYNYGDQIEIEYLCSNDKGGGTELMEALYGHIRRNQYAKLIKVTILLSAMGFYEKLGFKKGYGNNYSKIIK
jgi:hypothetical protein